jgi:hypothetical protein
MDAVAGNMTTMVGIVVSDHHKTLDQTGLKCSLRNHRVPSVSHAFFIL